MNKQVHHDYREPEQRSPPVCIEPKNSSKNNNSQVNTSKGHLSTMVCHDNKCPSTIELTTQSPLVYDATDIIYSVLQRNMSREDKKHELRKSIAQLRRQLQEKEEGEELKALMEEEEALRVQLAGPSKASMGKTSSKISKSGKNDQNGKKSLKHTDSIDDKQSVADAATNLQSLTGVKFDMSGFLGEETGAKKHEVDSIMSLSDTKKAKRQKQAETDTDSGSESDSSSADDDDVPVKRKNMRSGQFRSGRHEKPSNTKLVSNEWYAHTALDEALGGEREFNELSFNLLVAGEIEIINSQQISKKEIYSRLEVLKQLAYKHEVMSLRDILSQYASFVSKVEKGRFRWGSKRDLAAFEQQLMYTISIDRNQKEQGGTSRTYDKLKGKPMGKEERKKYCLDYNKGLCKLQSPHEGSLNGVTVTKHHICKHCLIDEGVERNHPSKDCVKK